VFLEVTLKRNRRLIEAALEYHHAGALPPNTYLIDYDTVRENARLLRDASRQSSVALFFITKQIGHNPGAIEAIREGGLPTGTAVDTTEAYLLAANHVRLGNVGHLTQVPTHDLDSILRLAPDYMTVFGVEKARQISAAAEGLKRNVDLILRVFAPGDYFHPGQVGGIALDGVVEAARTINALPCVRVAGVTSYPCVNAENGELRKLSNFDTILSAREQLERALGYPLTCVSAPGNTCVNALPLLASYGVTHGEPGHALTGTTPLHEDGAQPESPAMVYVSEVSHVQNRTAYIYGGGFYRRSRLEAALVAANAEQLAEPPVAASHPSADMIDYYGQLDDIPERVQVGDTVIAAFRTQIFVTRSSVAVVKGLHSGNATLSGLWDFRGRPMSNDMKADAYDSIR
jgi:predicted amino acid racemase